MTRPAEQRCRLLARLTVDPTVSTLNAGTLSHVRRVLCAGRLSTSAIYLIERLCEDVSRLQAQCNTKDA